MIDTNRLRFKVNIGLVYPIKALIIKILANQIKNHYGIKEIPWLETTPIKYWKQEFMCQWALENEVEFDELEEI